MEFFPCVQCHNQCEGEDALECCNCSRWVHRLCVPMTRSDFRAWSVNSMVFLCRTCCFINGEYDADIGLARLSHALDSGNSVQLYNAASSEQSLMNLYSVTLDDMAPDGHVGSLDTVSKRILESYQPMYLQRYVPLAVFGDGNCFYRAASRSLCGDEHLHVLLRLKTSLEIVLNRKYYDSTMRSYVDLIQDNRIVTSDYKKLLYDTITLNSFSDMSHFYALSSALNVPIRSYYPPQICPELASDAFSRKVVGRNVSSSQQATIAIMWTQMLMPANIRIFRPNHFVSLHEIGTDFQTQTEVTDDYSCSGSGLKLTNVHCETDIIDLTSDCDDCQERKSDNISNENIELKKNPFADHDGNDDTFDVLECSTDCLNPISIDLNENDDIIDLDQTKDYISCTKTTNPVLLDDDQNDDNNEPLTHEQSNAEDCMCKGLLENGKFLDTKIIINMLIHSDESLDRIPSGRKENVYFILNNELNLQYKENGGKCSFADDCGVWISGVGTCPKAHFILSADGKMKKTYLKNGLYCSERQVDGNREYIPIQPQPSDSEIAVVHRYYSTLSLNRYYKRKITYLGTCGFRSKLAVVEYVGKFPGLVPHGNGKDVDSLYVRTPDCVMSEMSDLLKSKKASTVYRTLAEKYDELKRPTSIAQVRDKLKYDRAKARGNGAVKNIADNIQVIENMVTKNHEYIRCIIRDKNKTPFIILYNDEQLSDLKNICCNGHSVLGVDKTYNLCDMHVTVTCYKQTSVQRTRTGAPPIFLGPVFIHDNSDFESYCQFFYHLKMKLADIDQTQFVIGSDDERAMVKAIVSAFPCSTHVLCCRHLKQNALKKLTDDAVDKKDRHDIINKLFGQEGVTLASTAISFEERCASFEQYCANKTQRFLRYFVDRLKPQLEFKVNQPIRHGYIAGQWTNNNCESINHVLKQAVDWKSRPLLELINSLETLVKGQFTDLRGALVGTGEYRLAESHKQFRVSKSDWLIKTDDQRSRHYSNFRRFTIKDRKYMTSTDGTSNIISPKSHGKKPGQKRSKRTERTVSLKRVKINKCEGNEDSSEN